MLAALDQLVPSTNFYRHLEARFDLSFVRDGVGDRYAERGRPRIDPVVFFKLQLILFCEGLRSERRLIETAAHAHVGIRARTAAEHAIAASNPPR